MKIKNFLLAYGMRINLKGLKFSESDLKTDF